MTNETATTKDNPDKARIVLDQLTAAINAYYAA